jgi:hypothetical protein
VTGNSEIDPEMTRAFDRWYEAARLAGRVDAESLKGLAEAFYAGWQAASRRGGFEQGTHS